MLRAHDTHVPETRPSPGGSQGQVQGTQANGEQSLSLQSVPFALRAPARSSETYGVILVIRGCFVVLLNKYLGPFWVVNWEIK